MIGLREICALLLGGAVSVPATVVVVEKRAERAPVVKKSLPTAKRTALPAPKPPTIPEPAAWAMMLAGFGLVGASLRRRAHG